MPLAAAHSTRSVQMNSVSCQIGNSAAWHGKVVPLPVNAPLNSIGFWISASSAKGEGFSRR